MFPPPAESPLWRRWKALYGSQFVAPSERRQPTKPSDFYVFRLASVELGPGGVSRGWRDRRSTVGGLSTCDVWLQEEIWDSEELLDDLPDATVTPLDEFLTARHTALFLEPVAFTRERRKRRYLPFMKKKMEPVEVEVTDDGSIRLASFGRDGTPREILLHPAQISLLCEWLREARDSIVGKESAEL